MQNLFLRKNNEALMIDIKIYLNELNKIAENLNLDIDLIITKPYWIYSKQKNNSLVLEKEIDEKVQKLICYSFKETSKIKKIYISDVNEKNLDINDLTSDFRHYKSTIIQLVEKKKLC